VAKTDPLINNIGCNTDIYTKLLKEII